MRTLLAALALCFGLYGCASDVPDCEFALPSGALVTCPAGGGVYCEPDLGECNERGECTDPDGMVFARADARCFEVGAQPECQSTLYSDGELRWHPVCPVAD